MTALGKAAIAYARRDWYVFPVAPGGKTPITKRGMLDASTDEGLVAAWWENGNRSKIGSRAAQRARPNIGISCGPSGLLVVDLDSEDAVHRWTDLAALHDGHPKTLVARTGKGYHVYFTGKGRSTASRIAPGIDTRSGGGYVIAPPSLHGSGAVYRWLDPSREPVPAPEWLLELLEHGRHHEDDLPGERKRLPDGVMFTPYGGSALDRITAEMASTAEGERNATLNALAYRCGRLSAAGQLADWVARRDLVAAALAAGLEADEAEKTFRSGFTAGMFRPAVVQR
jgi:Bifunctional DNA primase/polymerase, N-terminal